MTKQDFIELGGKEWEKNGMERVYINASIFNKLFGTAYGDNTNKFFFDCNENAVMRSHKGKKPQIVKRYN